MTNLTIGLLEALTSRLCECAAVWLNRRRKVLDLWNSNRFFSLVRFSFLSFFSVLKTNTQRTPTSFVEPPLAMVSEREVWSCDLLWMFRNWNFISFSSLAKPTIVHSTARWCVTTKRQSKLRHILGIVISGWVCRKIASEWKIVA